MMAGPYATPSKLIDRTIGATAISTTLDPRVWDTTIGSEPTQQYSQYSSYVTAANTAAFRTLWRGQTRSLNIACIGNSTTAGQTLSGGNTQGVNAYPMKLALALAASGVRSSANNCFGDKAAYGQTQTLPNLVAADARLAFTGGFVVGSTPAAGGASFAVSATGTMAFTTQGACNEAKIHWRDNGTGRNFTWQVDGGSTTQVNSAGNANFGTTTIPLGALTTHTITLAWVAGSVQILAIDAYDNTSPEIRIWNWGISGAQSSVFLNNADTGAGRLAMWNGLRPDAAFIEVGVINDWRNSIAIATSAGNVQANVQQQKQWGLAIVDIPTWDSGTAGLTAWQADYVAAMYGVAKTEGVPVFDMRKRVGWRNFAEANAAGFMSDQVHKTAAGYADEALARSDFLLSIL